MGVLPVNESILETPGCFRKGHTRKKKIPTPARFDSRMVGTAMVHKSVGAAVRWNLLASLLILAVGRGLVKADLPDIYTKKHQIQAHGLTSKPTD